MSKERSEKIEEYLHHIRGVLGIVGDQDTVNMAGKLAKLIDEQAERVRELEELKKHYMKQIQFLTHSWDKSKEQNKRQREGIEKALSIATPSTLYSADCSDVEVILRVALEGDPHD